MGSSQFSDLGFSVDLSHIGHIQEHGQEEQPKTLSLGAAFGSEELSEVYRL
jgi:hypothetical protein